MKMKLSNTVLLALSMAASVSGFAPSYNHRQAPQAQAAVSHVVVRRMAETEAKSLEVVEEKSMEELDEESALKRLGITEDELALGINPLELLQWIGTKDDLIQKFLRDNKQLNEERAEQEVAKFFMDAEMVNAYIKFERDKVENPPDLKAEAEQSLKDPKTIATYAAWLLGGASFGWVRNTFVEPKFASGEWEPIRIELPTPWWITEPEAAVDAVSSAAESSVDAVVSAAMDVAASSAV